MSNETIRVCSCCAEEVQKSAKVCPHCRQWLSFFSLRNPTIFIITFALAGLIAITAMTVSSNRSINRLQNVGADYVSYRDSISVVESRMNYNNDEKEPRGFVIVIMTNKSEIAWKDIELDIRLFDKAGVMLDARTYEDGSIILPHDELSCRIPFDLYKPMTEYAVHKVYVRGARDSHAPF